MTTNNKRYSLDTKSLLDLMVSKVNRFEVIDYRIEAMKHGTNGRVYGAEGMFIKVELSLQDDYQTLKVFISDK